MSYAFRAMSESAAVAPPELMLQITPLARLAGKAETINGRTGIRYLSGLLLAGRHARACLQRAHRCDVPHFLQPRFDRFGSARDSGSAVGDRRSVAVGITRW